MFIEYRYVAMFCHLWYTDQRHVEVRHELAPAQRLCLSCIFFVAVIFDLSGSMNTFLDGRPVL